ncbi:MAG: general secretion pathway protein GspK [Planctomycetota bacterium]
MIPPVDLQRHADRHAARRPDRHPDRRPAGRRRRPRSARGIILIVVLVVIVALSLSAYTYSEIMVTHRTATRLNGQQLQANLLVESGIDATRVFLAQAHADRDAAGGIYNNAQQFQGIVVVPDDDPKSRGNFSILAPAMDSDGNIAGVRYGLEDESARLNLNSLTVAEKALEGSGRQLLGTLPGMTDDIADAILDWLDEDDEQREYGAESSYYQGLSPGYMPANGPFTTVEELLLVRGITPELLFGLDTNRNGLIDAQEQSAGGSGDDTSTQLGWAAYLTLYSKEANVNSSGLPRINLNSEDLELLYNSLVDQLGNEQWATFIIAYRQNGPASATGQVQPTPTGVQLDFTKPAKTKITQVLDLIGASTTLTISGQPMAQPISSPFSSDIISMNAYLPQLMDNVTANSTTYLPGRVNINQAPKSVLQGIPGITEEILTELLSRREPEASESKPNQRFETWLLTEGIVTLDEMKSLSPFVCAGGDVYRGRIVGYFQGGQAASRAEVVFDAAQSPPRIILWRNVSHLGRGYPLETLGVDLGGN